ncbi:hypothetical protein T265_15511, partial [Opisthorchis viverrini]
SPTALTAIAHGLQPASFYLCLSSIPAINFITPSGKERCMVTDIEKQNANDECERVTESYEIKERETSNSKSMVFPNLSPPYLKHKDKVMPLTTFAAVQ